MAEQNEKDSVQTTSGSGEHRERFIHYGLQ